MNEGHMLTAIYIMHLLAPTLSLNLSLVDKYL